MAVDQPLFALAKKLQWSKSSVFSEDEFILRIGDLRNETTNLGMIFTILNRKGDQKIPILLQYSILLYFRLCVHCCKMLRLFF